MVSWLPHVLLPSLVALAFFRRLPRAWVMALAPVAWVPDLDYFTRSWLGENQHRVFTHNVWIPLAFALALVWLWRRRDPDARLTDFAVRPGWPVALLLVAYYWSTHILMDVFAGGVVLFWPLLDLNFYWFYEIHLDLSTGEVAPVEEHGVEQGPPQPSSDYTWFSYEHTAAVALLACCLAAGLAIRWWRRRSRSLAPQNGKGRPESDEP